MNKQGTHSGRYLVRQGIKDWMVWDRRAKGPVKTDRGRATGLTRERADEIKEELTNPGKNARSDPTPDLSGRYTRRTMRAVRQR
jgi:CRISPR/Cas system type I-B associated protein Csh2 (Cas7 group RAMP superfamily)